MFPSMNDLLKRINDINNTELGDFSSWPKSCTIVHDTVSSNDDTIMEPEPKLTSIKQKRARELPKPLLLLKNGPEKSVENHIILSAINVMKWINTNTRYKFPKSVKSWEKEICSKFSTLKITFPLSDFPLILSSECPSKYSDIKSYVSSNMFLEYDRMGIGIVKISVDTNKLFEFLVINRIIIGYGVRKMYRRKYYFDDCDFKNIQKSSIKHMRLK